MYVPMVLVSLVARFILVSWVCVTLVIPRGLFSLLVTPLNVSVGLVSEGLIISILLAASNL